MLGVGIGLLVLGLLILAGGVVLIIAMRAGPQGLDGPSVSNPSG